MPTLMKNRFLVAMASSVLSWGLWAVLDPGVAHAGLEACGDLRIDAQAQCEVVAEGCELQCTPPAVEAACAAELSANCEGQCDASASLSCTSECTVDCEAACLVDPGGFDCEAACNADCGATCAARCDSDDSECWASCEASCNSECRASCEVTPPDADCVAQCEACCGGSCEAEANLDCQIDCQADAFAQCKVDLQGGCEADCRQAGAALFCDGQWVNAADLDACVAALRSLLDGEAQGEASFECQAGECSLDTAGLLACAVSPEGRSGVPATMVVLLGAGLWAHRRRRRSMTEA